MSDQRSPRMGISVLPSAELAEIVRQGAHFYMAHSYRENEPSVGIGEVGYTFSTASHVAKGCKGCAAEAALAELARRTPTGDGGTQ